MHSPCGVSLQRSLWHRCSDFDVCYKRYDATEAPKNGGTRDCSSRPLPQRQFRARDGCGIDAGGNVAASPFSAQADVDGSCAAWAADPGQAASGRGALAAKAYQQNVAATPHRDLRLYPRTGRNSISAGSGKDCGRRSMSAGRNNLGSEGDIDDARGLGRAAEQAPPYLRLLQCDRDRRRPGRQTPASI